MLRVAGGGTCGGGRESMQVAHLTETTLDMIDMNLHIILKRTERETSLTA